MVRETKLVKLESYRIFVKQGRAAILLNDREKYILCLEDGISSSITLRSKKRFDESIHIFDEDMPIAWLNEAALQPVIEQFRLNKKRK